MKFSFPILFCLVALLPLTPSTLEAQQNPDNEQTNDKDNQDDKGAKVQETSIRESYWDVTFQDGSKYLVGLSHINSISMQKYVLDGSLLVTELNIDTKGGAALARFYYFEPLAESLGNNPGATGLARATGRVAERGHEILDQGARRLGIDAHDMVQKTYPGTTHSRTLEFRVLNLPTLETLYTSAVKSWQTNKGTKVVIAK